MIKSELRKWDEIQDKKDWLDFVNSLSKKEYSLYQSFRGYRGNLVKTENEIGRLNDRLEELKERKRKILKELTKSNHKIDHLRKMFHISVSISSWKHPSLSHHYCLGTIKHGGKKISFNLGNMVRKVRPHLLEFYKKNYPKKKMFDYQDLDTNGGRLDFVYNLNTIVKGDKCVSVLREYIRKSPKIKTIPSKVGLDLLFPIQK